MTKNFPVCGSSYICWIDSLKNRTRIRTRSRIEADYCITNEFNKEVIQYQYEPFWIGNTAYDNTYHQSKPDFLLETTSGLSIVEIKYISHLNKDHTKQQIAIDRAFAEENDIGFFILTEIDIYKESNFYNIKLFWRYARLELTNSYINSVINFMCSQAKPIIFRNLAYFLATNQETLEYSPVIYNLLFRHILEVDMTKNITVESELWVNPVYRQ